jgi:hypothetical protein
MIIDTQARSPLDPRALCLDDVKPGVDYIKWNLNSGIREIGTFTSLPYFLDERYGLAVHTEERDNDDLHFRITGHTDAYLGDMGITPYNGKVWNDKNVTVLSTVENVLALAKKPTVPFVSRKSSFYYDWAY